MVDMWAKGCTWFEILHLKSMFSGSIVDLIDDIRGIQLQKFEVECPVDFKNAIMRCFEENPANRPDALEFLEVAENVRLNLQLTRALPTKVRSENFIRI